MVTSPPYPYKLHYPGLHMGHPLPFETCETQETGSWREPEGGDPPSSCQHDRPSVTAGPGPLMNTGRGPKGQSELQAATVALEEHVLAQVQGCDLPVTLSQTMCTASAIQRPVNSRMTWQR